MIDCLILNNKRVSLVNGVARHCQIESGQVGIECKDALSYTLFYIKYQ